MMLSTTSGPGPLQALANGCPYIQPKFIPPRGRKNEVCIYLLLGNRGSIGG